MIGGRRNVQSKSLKTDENMLRNPSKVKDYLQKMKDKKNQAHIKISTLREKENVFSEWMGELDTLQRKELKSNPSVNT